MNRPGRGAHRRLWRAPSPLTAESIWRVTAAILARPHLLDARDPARLHQPRVRAQRCRLCLAGLKVASDA